MGVLTVDFKKQVGVERHSSARLRAGESQKYSTEFHETAAKVRALGRRNSGQTADAEVRKIMEGFVPGP
jgi:hypothetical protein